MTNQDLIINGVDHSKSDLEWAKRGGVLTKNDNHRIREFYKLTYLKHSGGGNGQQVIWPTYCQIGSDNIRRECVPFHSKKDNDYMRMATPAECEAAGIEYIEYHGWRPIESAPIGSLALVTDGKWVGEAFINRANAEMLTHWMPLPLPPKDE